jgi:hypothetical protein
MIQVRRFMRSRKSAVPYLILNILVSAATTLLVLLIWNLFQKPAFVLPDGTGQDINIGVQPTVPSCPASLSDLPSIDQTVIEILNVYGSGDVYNEVVELGRVGDGDLCLTGWQLFDEQNHTYTFPNLVLNKDGAISIYSRPGNDRIDSLFWGSDEPIWNMGDTVTLIDSDGNVRATFEIE